MTREHRVETRKYSKLQNNLLHSRTNIYTADIHIDSKKNSLLRTFKQFLCTIIIDIASIYTTSKLTLAVCHHCSASSLINNNNNNKKIGRVAQPKVPL